MDLRLTNSLPSQTDPTAQLGAQVTEIPDPTDDVTVTQTVTTLAKLHDLETQICTLRKTITDGPLAELETLVKEKIQKWLAFNKSGPPEIDPKDVHLIKVIGEGGFGLVYEGTIKGLKVAVKKPLSQELDAAKLENFRKELQTVRQIFHPNVVLVIGGCSQPDNVFIVFELMELSALSYLDRPDYQQLTVFDRLKLIKDVAQGLTWLHGLGFIHRDLKLENILLDEKKTAKVADFGLSIKTHINPASEKVRGNVLYRAPELWVSPTLLTQASDVFSFGILFWEFYSGKLWNPPSRYSEPNTYRSFILSKKRPPLPSTWPLGVKQLISACWDQEPTTRPTTQQILERLEQVIFDVHLETHLGPVDSSASQFWRTSFNQMITVPVQTFLLKIAEVQAVELDDLIDLLYLLSSDWSADDPLDTLLDHVSMSRFALIQSVFGQFFLRGKLNLEEMDVVNEEWFFGNISRVRAEEKLKNQRDGTFLVRLSERYPFVISVVQKGISHIAIEKDSNGMYDISKRKFHTLKECLGHALERGQIRFACPRMTDEEVETDNRYKKEFS